MTDHNDVSGDSPVTTRRGVRSFVLRQGRMTEGQKKAYDRSWPKYGLTREQGMIDPRQIFGRDNMLNLEIGFGMGKSLADMAEAAPEQVAETEAPSDPEMGAYIDEEMLRSMVTEIVRQELQGKLGERITRSVRKLVRQEIHRALMSQEFE